MGCVKPIQPISFNVWFIAVCNTRQLEAQSSGWSWTEGSSKHAPSTSKYWWRFSHNVTYLVIATKKCFFKASKYFSAFIKIALYSFACHLCSPIVKFHDARYFYPKLNDKYLNETRMSMQILWHLLSAQLFVASNGGELRSNNFAGTFYL